MCLVIKIKLGNRKIGKDKKQFDFLNYFITLKIIRHKNVCCRSSKKKFTLIHKVSGNNNSTPAYYRLANLYSVHSS